MTAKELFEALKGQLNAIVRNQDALTNFGLIAALAGGHILIEGVPGLAKTLWARVFAASVGVDFARTQFTSDLMPADILGTKVFNQKSAEFELRKGPLFTQLFLADEINRTPPKTQSALLEVMEERSITLDGETYKMQEPFFVMATQNPIEFEGTYPLPEALLDRFMMKISVGYPGVVAEKEVLRACADGFEHMRLTLTPVCSAEDFGNAREEIKAVTVEDGILDYALSIVETTRRIGVALYGASPRASVALLLSAKALAATEGRDYVIPDDIKTLAPHILSHRVILKPEAEMNGVKPEEVVLNVLSQIKVPR